MGAVNGGSLWVEAAIGGEDGTVLIEFGVLVVEIALFAIVAVGTDGLLIVFFESKLAFDAIVWIFAFFIDDRTWFC